MSSFKASVDAMPPTTPTGTPTRNYEVFLNHRGEVKKGFLGHLAEALKSAGVHCFVDYEDLHAGDKCWDAIESAIRHSKVHIAIFSPDYASSTWCLRELHEMLECRNNGCSQLFLPVFFNVEPSDLRHSSSPKSCYSTTIAKLRKRNDEEVVLNWRKALHDASMVSGLTLDTVQGFEARLLKLIVSKVLNALNCTPLEIAKHPVGVDEKLGKALDLMKTHNVSQGFHKFGIYGMGGVGKTTLAKSIYNEIYRDFDRVCFMESVRSEAEAPNGLRGVQERMLRALMNEATIDVTSISHGKQIIKARLWGLKILLVLDDVDDRKHVEVLVSPFESCLLKDGSQLVMTTRDEQIVTFAKAQQKLFMEGLSEKHAHLLFDRHAFLHLEERHKDLTALAKKVVAACQGLPLALETLGAHLYGKDMAVWEATVKVLEGRRRSLTPGQREVTQILRISYDGLGREERLMFLDIACFMLGESEDLARRIWCDSDSALLSLGTLRLKSLVKIDKDRSLTMHDCLRDMGREIVEECSHGNEWLRSHLWNEAEVQNVLQQRKGGSEVRGVRLQTSFGQQKEVDSKSFAGMDCLKFLLLRGVGVTITGDLGLLPKELRWFEWQKCPLESLPRKLGLSKVAVLDLGRSAVASLSNGHMFENLRELRLRGCKNIRKEQLPDFRVCCKKLEVLDLWGCEELESVPESIGCLSSTLTHLDLSCCHKLTMLPDGLVRLHSLKSLRLDGCRRLKRLPDAIGQLTALEEIGLEWLDSLVRLPQSLGNLTKLSSLKLGLSENRVIEELPSTIGNLTNLSSLQIDLSSSENWNLVGFPENIGSLRKLVTLSLLRCKSLSYLPASIGELEELVTADFTFCNICALPEEFCNLSSLRELCLQCNPLSRLPEHLHLLSGLRTLDLSNCQNLREIPQLPSSLEKLDTSCCHNLRVISALPASLKHLEVSFCNELQELIGLDALSHLEKLDAEGCRGLQSVDVFHQLASLTSLKRLKLWGTRISLGPWIEKLVSLETVSLDGENLPDCFSRCKEEFQVVGSNVRECRMEVRVPHMGDGRECKGVVLCVASLYGFKYGASIAIRQLEGEVHRVAKLEWFWPFEDGHAGMLQILLCRATTDPFVASLKYGDTLSVELTMYEENSVLPDVAVRLVYEAHEIEEILAELACGGGR